MRNVEVPFVGGEPFDYGQAPALELIELRRAAGLSHGQLAELLGLSRVNYMDYERAQVPITSDFRARVKDVLAQVKKGALKPNPNPSM